MPLAKHNFTTTNTMGLMFLLLGLTGAHLAYHSTYRVHVMD